VVEILYKSKNAVVIYKPSGIPSQADPTGDKDAMALTAEKLCESGENSSLWLIHRLDRVVGGLLVFARNKKYAAILSEYVKDRLVTKEYYAVVDGEAEGGALENLIFKDARSGKAFIVDRDRQGTKPARLTYRRLASVETEKGTKTLIYITLDTGRFHQIRAQMSHIKHPITGDGKYGSRDTRAKSLALMASHLAIDLPGESIDVSRLPELDTYPWSLFDCTDYEL
jgi:23S rRNA pseudouridine1911/1915/1917 synthase